MWTLGQQHWHLVKNAESIAGCTPDPLNKNMNFSKILRWFLCLWKSEKCQVKTARQCHVLEPLTWIIFFSRECPWAPGSWSTPEACWVPALPLDSWRAAMVSYFSWFLQCLQQYWENEKRESISWTKITEGLWKKCEGSLWQASILFPGAHLVLCP